MYLIAVSALSIYDLSMMLTAAILWDSKYMIDMLDAGELWSIFFKSTKSKIK